MPFQIRGGQSRWKQARRIAFAQPIRKQGQNERDRLLLKYVNPKGLLITDHSTEATIDREISLTGYRCCVVSSTTK